MMLLILDWDGTLLNSSAKIIACMQRAAHDLGLPALSDSQVKKIIGLGLPEAIKTLFPATGEAERTEFRERYAERFIAADQTPCDFFPGVLDTLGELKETGHHLAVATGKSRRGLDRVLHNLDMQDFFHATRCADETRSKPHPMMVEELLTEFSLPAAEVLLVGDTSYDLDMARQAEVASVGVTYGVHDPEVLKACQPVTLIDHFTELLDLVADWPRIVNTN